MNEWRLVRCTETQACLPIPVASICTSPAVFVCAAPHVQRSVAIAGCRRNVSGRPRAKAFVDQRQKCDRLCSRTHRRSRTGAHTLCASGLTTDGTPQACECCQGVGQSGLEAKRSSMNAAHKPLYKSLYLQVIVAIVIGIL